MTTYNRIHDVKGLKSLLLTLLVCYCIRLLLHTLTHLNSELNSYGIVSTTSGMMLFTLDTSWQSAATRALLQYNALCWTFYITSFHNIGFWPETPTWHQASCRLAKLCLLLSSEVDWARPWPLAGPDALITNVSMNCVFLPCFYCVCLFFLIPVEPDSSHPDLTVLQ